jgi:F-type H+-transporting ATPase subunit epsilon
MAETFMLKILACDELFFEGEVIQLVFPTKDGEWGVLANHTQMVSTVVIGEIRFQTPDEKWHSAIVSDGFIDVRNNKANVIVYSCERPEDIDRFRAEAALERAKEQMITQQSIKEYHISSASLARAMARLKYSQKDIQVR